MRTLLAAATRQLGTDSRVEAELLLARALGRTRAWLFAWPEYEVDTTQAAEFERLIAARAHGEPVSYLTGHREFWSLDLLVTPDVLIPRPETELLVEQALALIPLDADFTLADLGTGSGAIALAVARERPRAQIVATDASAAALTVARSNARRLDIGNIEFAQGDWCVALGERRFDVIVANPPYIESADTHLAQGDLRFEPVSALASGADGLDAIRSIVACAPAHLRARGWLLLEHGWNQGARVRDLLATCGFSDVASVIDGGAHERVSVGRMRV